MEKKRWHLRGILMTRSVTCLKAEFVTLVSLKVPSGSCLLDLCLDRFRLVLAQKPHSRAVRRIVVSEDKPLVATVGDDGTVFFFAFSATTSGINLTPTRSVVLPEPCVDFLWRKVKDKAVREEKRENLYCNFFCLVALCQILQYFLLSTLRLVNYPASSLFFLIEMLGYPLFPPPSKTLNCVLVTQSGRVLDLSPGGSVQEEPEEHQSHVLDLRTLEAHEDSRRFVLPPFVDGGGSGSGGGRRRSRVVHAQWLKRFPEVLVALVVTRYSGTRRISRDRQPRRDF